MPDEAPVMTATRPEMVSVLIGEAPVSVDAGAVEARDPLGVGVVEELRRAGVEPGDAGHVVVAELEVEDVDVLSHSLRPDRFGDHDDLALDEPAQDGLGDRLAVRGAD